jgi:hypothetical protein
MAIKSGAKDSRGQVKTASEFPKRTKSTIMKDINIKHRRLS